jgi:hypothetical protein
MASRNRPVEEDRNHRNPAQMAMHANNRHVILKSLDLHKYNWFMDVNNNSNSIVFPAAFTLLPHKFGLRCAAGMNHLPAEKRRTALRTARFLAFPAFACNVRVKHRKRQGQRSAEFGSMTWRESRVVCFAETLAL